MFDNFDKNKNPLSQPTFLGGNNERFNDGPPNPYSMNNQGEMDSNFNNPNPQQPYSSYNMGGNPFMQPNNQFSPQVNQTPQPQMPQAPQQSRQSGYYNNSVGNYNNNEKVIMNIPVDVQIVLGTTTLPISTLMNLKRDSVITLDSSLGDPVDIVINGKVIARGQLVPVEGNPSHFGVSLIEILNKTEHY